MPSQSHVALYSPTYKPFVVFVTALWAEHDLLSTNTLNEEDSVKTVSPHYGLAALSGRNQVLVSC